MIQAHWLITDFLGDLGGHLQPLRSLLCRPIRKESRARHGLEDKEIPEELHSPLIPSRGLGYFSSSSDFTTEGFRTQSVLRFPSSRSGPYLLSSYTVNCRRNWFTILVCAPWSIPPPLTQAAHSKFRVIPCPHPLSTQTA